MALDYLIDLQRDAPLAIGNKAKNICFLIERKFSAPRPRLERDERTKTAAELLGKRLPMAISPFVWVNTVNPA